MFTEFCSGNGIEHIVASVRRPSTIGKIEAFHKANVCESWMFPTHESFVSYWNYERPHRGIGYLYPADVYLCEATSRIRILDLFFSEARRVLIYAVYLFEASILTIVVFGTLPGGFCSYFTEAFPHIRRCSNSS